MGNRCKVWQLPASNAVYDLKNIWPPFVGESIAVGFCACFSYTLLTALVPIWKSTEDERKSDRYQLGFNAHKYVHQILIPHLEPLELQAGAGEAGVQNIDDCPCSHTLIDTKEYRKYLDIDRMDWPFYSPDFNQINHGSLYSKQTTVKQSGRGREFPLKKRSWLD